MHSTFKSNARPLTLPPSAGPHSERIWARSTTPLADALYQLEQADRDLALVERASSPDVADHLRRERLRILAHSAMLESTASNDCPAVKRDLPRYSAYRRQCARLRRQAVGMLRDVRE